MKILKKKQKENKTYYNFLGIPFFKKIKQKNCITYIIFGVKIFSKNQYNLIEELETIKEDIKGIKLLQSYYNDLEKLPQSKGILRIFQLTSLKLMKEIDKICRENNVKYFMICGTLLGAIRHKGFIPWDDDLDIVILREDIDKFIQTLNKKFNNQLISCYYWSNTYFNVLKVILKLPNTSIELCPFVDIHVFDTYNGFMDDNKYNALKLGIENLSKSVDLIQINDIANQQEEIKSNISKIQKYTNNYLLKDNKDNKDNNKSIFMGAEFPLPKLICLEYNDVFPLVPLLFEDKEFFAPRNYYKFLYENYGDFMKPHIDGDMYHFNANNFTYEQIRYMEEFIKKE